MIYLFIYFKKKINWKDFGPIVAHVMKFNCPDKFDKWQTGTLYKKGQELWYLKSLDKIKKYIAIIA